MAGKKISALTATLDPFGLDLSGARSGTNAKLDAGEFLSLGRATEERTTGEPLWAKIATATFTEDTGQLSLDFMMSGGMSGVDKASGTLVLSKDGGSYYGGIYNGIGNAAGTPLENTAGDTCIRYKNLGGGVVDIYAYYDNDSANGMEFFSWGLPYMVANATWADVNEALWVNVDPTVSNFALVEWNVGSGQDSYLKSLQTTGDVTAGGSVHTSSLYLTGDQVISVAKGVTTGGSSDDRVMASTAWIQSNYFTATYVSDNFVPLAGGVTMSGALSNSTGFYSNTFRAIDDVVGLNLRAADGSLVATFGLGNSQNASFAGSITNVTNVVFSGYITGPAATFTTDINLGGAIQTNAASGGVLRNTAGATVLTWGASSGTGATIAGTLGVGALLTASSGIKTTDINFVANNTSDIGVTGTRVKTLWAYNGEFLNTLNVGNGCTLGSNPTADSHTITGKTTYDGAQGWFGTIPVGQQSATDTASIISALQAYGLLS